MRASRAPSATSASSSLHSPDAAKVFLTADGGVPEIGALIRQPDLAQTLEAIADKALKGSTRDAVAQGLVSGVRAGGGIWTLGGSRRLRGGRAQAAGGRIPWRAHRVGIAALLGRRRGGGCPQYSLGVRPGSVDSATRKHSIVEAMRRAYRDRAVYLGDPDFVQMPLAQLASKDYAAGQRSSIRPDKAMPSDLLPGIETAPVGLHTTHFSILDADGNRVAGTLSVNLFFGTGDMRSENRRAAQQHHGRFLDQARHAERVRAGGQRRERRSRPTSGRCPA